MLCSLRQLINVRPLGLHYNHYVSVRPLPISENAHDSWTTWHILITFCIQIHVNIILPLTYIYIHNVATLDETIIPSCLHFSMQNIEQSRGLGRASRWNNVNVNQ